MDLNIVILAAGQGKRMRSRLPKVLHPLGGKPLLAHVVATAERLSPKHIYIVHSKDNRPQLEAALSSPLVTWVEQAEQKGTGHALQCVLPFLPADGAILVLLGDVPLVQAETLRSLMTVCQSHTQPALGLVTATVLEPAGLGRVIRDNSNHIVKIVEHRDATPLELAVSEVNTGIMMGTVQCFSEWLPKLKAHNAQHEFYLTDIFRFAYESQVEIVSVKAPNPQEVLGVNDRLQLAAMERLYQKRLAESWLQQGVSIADPNRFDSRGELKLGEGASIDVNVVFEGKVSIGEGVFIGPFCFLKNCSIGDHVRVEAFTHCEGAIVGKGCVIGPYARLRPGTVLEQEVKIGNFVEIKKTTMAERSKANHLAYIGDAVIGRDVNIGAGTITCNYDGVNKHQTIIEDGAFIGSNTELVAPVSVGKGATIGAGTTLTKSAPAGQLTLSRVAQKTVSHWQRPSQNKEDGE